MVVIYRNRYQLKIIYKVGKLGMDLLNIKGVVGIQVFLCFEVIVVFGFKILRKIGMFLKKYIVDSLY